MDQSAARSTAKSRLDGVELQLRAFHYHEALANAAAVLAQLQREQAAAGSAGAGDFARQMTESRARAHQLYAAAAFCLDDNALAEEHFQAAQTLYDELAEARLALVCQVRLSQVMHRRGDLQRALHLASLALASAREFGWLEIEGLCLSTVGNVAWKRGDRQAAIGDLSRAVALFERLGLEDELQRARGTLGFVLALEGRPDEGEALMLSALGYFAECGEVTMQAKTLSNLAYTHYMRGELPEARDLMLRSAELEEQCPDRSIILSAWYNLGLIELRCGWLDSAKRSFIRAQELALEVGDPVVENVSPLYIGVVEIYNGQVEEALRLFAASRRSLEGSAVTEAALPAYYEAVGQLAAGHLEQARQLWQMHAAPQRLRDCADDFRILCGLLGKLAAAPDLTSSTRGLPRLESASRETAGAWRDELLAALKQMDAR